MTVAKTALSVLIPTYNDACVKLVRPLLMQLRAEAIDFEVIVAEDGSSDANTLATNAVISQWEGCRYIQRTQNVGRAAIRNFLAREARYPYLLFIDADMTVMSDQFIHCYVISPCDTVIDGGITVGGNADSLQGNLRYRYEKSEEPNHVAGRRQQQPYQHLHTANLFIRRDIMLQHPFDERFRNYGYEDVLLGKALHQHHIAIEHIDNPLGFCTFETNADFVAKTEEGLRTLHTFRSELRGYSRLLTFVGNIHLAVVRGAIRLWHRLFGKLERRWLCSRHPNLLVFKMYRLGYYMSL